MSTHIITQLDYPKSNGHLTNKKYVDENFVMNTTLVRMVNEIGDVAYVRKTEHLQGSATGDIDMDTHIISQSTRPTNANHLANKEYVDIKNKIDKWRITHEIDVENKKY